MKAQWQGLIFMLASAFILALLVLRFCTETHAADLYPPPPAPSSMGLNTDRFRNRNAEGR
jgi:hypothetical protein